MQNSQLTYKFFLLLMVVISIGACRHEFQDNTPFVQIDECSPSRDSMLQYYYFKTGTYWIYEEQTTGVLDSQVVSENLDTTYQNGVSEFATHIHSFHDDYTYVYFHQSIDDFESWVHPPCIRNKIWVDKYRTGVEVVEALFLFYPFVQDEYFANSSWQNGVGRTGRSTISEIMDGYSVGHETLNHVVRFHVDIDEVNYNNESTYDIAKNIGFVRRTRHLEDSTYEEWKLIRWHIVQ